MIGNQGLGILLGLLPAVMLVGGATVCAAVAAARPRTRPSLFRWISLVATTAAFAASLIELLAMSPEKSGVGLVAYSGGLIVDRFHVFGTVLVCAILALTVLGSETYMRRFPTRAGAFCALLQVSAAAAVMLLAQREMVAFTAAFALILVSLVLLTAMTKTSGLTAEVAFRQVLSGGIALATAVYGMTLLYAATGTTDLAQVRDVRVDGTAVDGVLAAVGIAMVVIGLLAVVGAPPLQAWTRHLQEDTPAPVAGFGSAVGVVTGTSVLARFAVEGFGAGSSRWTLLVSALAAIAMLTGGVLALRATTVRRLVADLSVTQAGFLLLAVTATGRGIDGAVLAGPTALLFSLMGGAVALVAVLLLTGVFEAAGLPGALAAYRGVGRRAPATAAFLSLALLSLAGLPPFAGFIGRLIVAESALDSGGGWAVATAAVGAVLSAVAVTRWLVVMYGDDNGEAPFAVRTTPLASRLTAWSAAALGLLLAGAAGPLISLAGGGATALH
jgi:NADH-quinone oxidoreductase subunit N